MPDNYLIVPSSDVTNGRITTLTNARLTSDLALTVGQLPNGVPVSVFRTAQSAKVTPAAASIQLQADTVVGPAPLSVAFEVVATGLNLYRETTETDFGDPGSVFDRLPSDMPWGNNANVCKSPFPGHTFEAPGTYTVQTTVTTREGQVYTAQTTIEVQEPDAQFPGTQTLVVSPSGNYAGAPAGAAQYLTIDDAIAAIPINLAAQTTNYRILLRAGETHPKADSGITTLTSALEGYYRYIGRFGDPADPNPVIDMTGVTANRRIGSDVDGHSQWYGVDIIGPWDETATDLSALVATFGMDFSGSGKHGVHDCKINGLATGIRTFNDTSIRLVVTNVEIENWQDYAVKVGDCRGGVYGSTWLRSPNANGNGAASPKTHGGFRGTAQFKFALYNIDTFQNSGWTGIGGVPVHQSHVRVNTNGAIGRDFHVCKMRGEGAWMPLMLYASGGGGAAPEDQIVSLVCPYLVEDCIFTATANTDSFVGVGFTGGYMRNLLLIHPNVPMENGTSIGGAFRLEPIDQALYSQFGNDTGHKSIPIIAENLHFVDLRNDTNSGGLDATMIRGTNIADAGYDLQVLNSVLHAPNRGIPQIDNGPFDTTELTAARYAGLQFSNPNASQPLDASFATPVGSISLYQPLAGAGALSGASGVMPTHDLLGNPRGTSTARGAYASPLQS